MPSSSSCSLNKYHYFFLCLNLFIISLFHSAYAACPGLGCSCSVTAGSHEFGNYAPLSGNSVDGTSNISVTCSALVALNVSYTIALNTGGSGSYTNRRMIFSSNNLNYNLYTTAGRTIVWGDGSGGSSIVNDAYNVVLLSVTRNYTVYGRIPASQNVPPGTYTDTIGVTVTY